MFYRRFLPFSLRTVLTIPFIMLLIVTVLLTNTLSLQKSYHAQENITKQLIVQINDRVYDFLEYYLSVQNQIKRNNINTAIPNRININNLTDIEKYILLSNLHTYLQKLTTTNSGILFLIEQNGYLIASSTDELPDIQTSDGKRGQILSTQSENPLIQAASHSLKLKFPDFHQINQLETWRFSEKQQTYFAQVKPYKNKYGANWLIVTFLPEFDFMNEIKVSIQNIINITILAVLLAIALGLVIANWITASILNLSQPLAIIATGNLNESIPQNQPIRELEIIINSVNQMVQQLRDEAAKPKEILGYSTNITDHKQAEIELQKAKETAEAANQAKSIFLANMSHELRTPLNIILGFTQILQRDLFLNHEQKENLQIIHRSGNHLLNLINEILDLSRIEAGNMALNETSFDLMAFLNSLQEMFRPRADSKNLQLHFHIAANLPEYITSDVNKLRQVLINLLSNAIKFTEQGSVTLCAEIRDVKTANNDENPLILHFEVADTGIGIATEELNTIFDAFVQSQHSHSSSQSGITPEKIGLGLSISHKFVQLMNGNISVTSQINQGSIFYLDIPVRLATAETVTPNSSKRRVMGLAPGHPSYRILVVDDQPENRQLLIRMLAQLDLEVREAKNGEEAIKQWQEWQPDLIWMDIRMPGIDGYEATIQIRSLPGGHIPIIIALTAQANNSNRILALNAGCNDYVIKPFQEQELFAKMELYLDLQYIYADDLHSQSLVSNIENEQSITLTPENLFVMSSNWLSELFQATLCCDEEEVLELIAQIPETEAILSAGLKSLVRNYQFQTILQLISVDDQEKVIGDK
ncbi:response regulator [Sphaerospermopsis aphanizomenoides BCCUSP55]|uniref:response regulator n=1 Tax=Sphaerospermopsis aphanizomenoides TaxID=459663 RepID=UPI001902FC25|nr:response regulator [Sphaerospermopsis aphanizomenoides]MBK1987248.1 response regulator [Sphaerospermopsis aphanizomenoides BCCUSP55]